MCCSNKAVAMWNWFPERSRVVGGRGLHSRCLDGSTTIASSGSEPAFLLSSRCCYSPRMFWLCPWDCSLICGLPRFEEKLFVVSVVSWYRLKARELQRTEAGGTRGSALNRGQSYRRNNRKFGSATSSQPAAGWFATWVASSLRALAFSFCAGR